MANYESIIGLEVHAQLKTKSKMFCACSTNYGDKPNTNICPVCTAQPGTLPTVNKMAIEMAIKAGLAIGCDLQMRSVFARKNYFYPDLPKGYQISQYEFPICLGGHLDVRTKEGIKRISIIRIHLEEDAGKLLHDFGNTDVSHVDFNRCGVPLIEIVSGPDMRSPKEGGDYLRTLRNVLVYLDICEGNMEEGNFRCDANVSIRKFGETKLGIRTEVKNLNSFKAVERALQFEIGRQIQVVESGGKVVLETLLWNDIEGKTSSMRSKEEAHDYRYFPDPDLAPLVIDDAWINQIKKDLPELALARAERFVAEHGIPVYDADILTDDQNLADFYEAMIKAGAPAKKAANWIISELLRELKDKGIGVTKSPITPKMLASLIMLIESGEITGKIAKDVFIEMFRAAKDPEKIVKEKGLKQVSDFVAIEKAVDEVISAFSDQVLQYKGGKQQVMGFLVGQVMKLTKGQANPPMVNEILKKKLG